MELDVFIVDDDRRLLSVLKGLLGEEGHRVTASMDGLDAVETCEETYFDLVITDLMLPGASGIEVLKACKRAHPETLVVLITGFASLETAIQAIREGAYDYITKPFKMEEMKIVVRNAAEHIRLIKENKRLIGELHEAYEQIRMVKQIMGPGDREEEPGAEARENPLIAGSMLPHSYVENLPGGRPAFLSDLERISSLREKGFLSEEEFRICKARLLQDNRTS